MNELNNYIKKSPLMYSVYNNLNELTDTSMQILNYIFCKIAHTPNSKVDSSILIEYHHLAKYLNINYNKIDQAIPHILKMSFSFTPDNPDKYTDPQTKKIFVENMSIYNMFSSVNICESEDGMKAFKFNLNPEILVLFKKDNSITYQTINLDFMITLTKYESRLFETCLDQAMRHGKGLDTKTLNIDLEILQETMTSAANCLPGKFIADYLKPAVVRLNNKYHDHFNTGYFIQEVKTIKSGKKVKAVQLTIDMPIKLKQKFTGENATEEQKKNMDINKSIKKIKEEVKKLEKQGIDKSYVANRIKSSSEEPKEKTPKNKPKTNKDLPEIN